MRTVAGVARVEDERAGGADIGQRVRHRLVREGGQAHHRPVRSRERLLQSAREQSRTDRALAEDTLVAHAAGVAEGRDRGRIAIPPAHLVAGERQLDDRRCTPGAGPDHSDRAHTE
jgi:hypothetical protein